MNHFKKYTFKNKIHVNFSTVKRCKHINEYKDVKTISNKRVLLINMHKFDSRYIKAILSIIWLDI